MCFYSVCMSLHVDGPLNSFLQLLHPLLTPPVVSDRWPTQECSSPHCPPWISSWRKPVRTWSTFWATARMGTLLRRWATWCSSTRRHWARWAHKSYLFPVALRKFIWLITIWKKDTLTSFSSALDSAGHDGHRLNVAVAIQEGEDGGWWKNDKTRRKWGTHWWQW